MPINACKQLANQFTACPQLLLANIIIVNIRHENTCVCVHIYIATFLNHIQEEAYKHPSHKTLTNVNAWSKRRRAALKATRARCIDWRGIGTRSKQPQLILKRIVDQRATFVISEGRPGLSAVYPYVCTNYCRCVVHAAQGLVVEIWQVNPLG
jgi:hypothetical protein